MIIKSSLGGIWDDRASNEGIYFDIKNFDEERKQVFKKKIQFIEDEMNKRKLIRQEMFGSVIESIN